MNNGSISSQLFHVYDGWMRLMEEEISIADLISQKENLSIAVLGMGSTALHLCKQLKGSKVSVKFIIDASEDDYFIDIPIYGLENVDLSGLDMIIYTNPIEEKFILEKLRRKYSGNIVSISDLVFKNIRRNND